MHELPTLIGNPEAKHEKEPNQRIHSQTFIQQIVFEDDLPHLFFIEILNGLVIDLRRHHDFEHEISEQRDDEDGIDGNEGGQAEVIVGLKGRPEDDFIDVIVINQEDVQPPNKPRLD